MRLLVDDLLLLGATSRLTYTQTLSPPKCVPTKSLLTIIESRLPVSNIPSTGQDLLGKENDANITPRYHQRRITH